MLGADFISRKTKYAAWGCNYRREKKIPMLLTFPTADLSLSTTCRRRGNFDTHPLGKATVKSVVQKEKDRVLDIGTETYSTVNPTGISWVRYSRTERFY